MEYFHLHEEKRNNCFRHRGKNQPEDAVFSHAAEQVSQRQKAVGEQTRRGSAFLTETLFNWQTQIITGWIWDEDMRTYQLFYLCILCQSLCTACYNWQGSKRGCTQKCLDTYVVWSRLLSALRAGQNCVMMHSSLGSVLKKSKKQNVLAEKIVFFC